jgi:hypothetical protein
MPVTAYILCLLYLSISPRAMLIDWPTHHCISTIYNVHTDEIVYW